MLQEPYETNSDANDMAPIDSTTEIGGGMVGAEITSWAKGWAESIASIESVSGKAELGVLSPPELLMPRDFIKTSLNTEGTHVDASDLNASLVDAALVNPIPAEVTHENLKASVTKIVGAPENPTMVPDDEINARLDAIAEMMKAQPLIEEVVENRNLAEMIDNMGWNQLLLELPKIPAETLAAIEEQNAKTAQLLAGEQLPKVVYIPTAAPLADAISKPIDTTHIQVGRIHFRNPA